MKEGIHPEYKDTVISCGCGEKIHTRSTRQNLTVGICSKCHPFFTGKQKFVDAAGRVEKFQRRYGWGADTAQKMTEKHAKPAAAPEHAAGKPAEEPKKE